MAIIMWEKMLKADLIKTAKEMADELEGLYATIANQSQTIETLEQLGAASKVLEAENVVLKAEIKAYGDVATDRTKLLNENRQLTIDNASLINQIKRTDQEVAAWNNIVNGLKGELEVSNKLVEQLQKQVQALEGRIPVPPKKKLQELLGASKTDPNPGWDHLVVEEGTDGSFRAFYLKDRFNNRQFHDGCRDFLKRMQNKGAKLGLQTRFRSGMNGEPGYLLISQ